MLAASGSFANVPGGGQWSLDFMIGCSLSSLPSSLPASSGHAKKRTLYDASFANRLSLARQKRFCQIMESLGLAGPAHYH